VAAYNPKCKEHTSKVHTTDPLIRLVNNYDVSKTEIGMIWFANDVTESEDYYYVGKLEVDYLFISKFSFEVVILPFDDPLNIAYRCAQNSFLFLDALIEAGKFLETCGVDWSLSDDEKIICSMAEHCAEIAGDEKYKNFYKVLLGCFL
jgi:hypothetical protein